MALSETYLVTDKLMLVPEREIDLLEKHFERPVPPGYREFMTRLGVGQYCDFVRVYPPLRILMQYEQMRQFWQENFFWAAGVDILSREEVVQSTIFGDTVDGDQIIAPPYEPDRLYVLSRHDNTICRMEDGFNEPLLWHGSTFAPQWSPLRYFQSFVNRASVALFTGRRDMKLDRIADRFIDRWEGSELRQIKEEDCRTIFIKNIGGRVQLAQSHWDRRIRIDINFDKDHWHEVNAFLNILAVLDFFVTGSSEG